MSLKKRVSKHLKDLCSLDNIAVETPKDKTMGDFSTPIAFSLAKTYKKSPMLIADELSEKLQSSNFLYDINAVKGFVNFRVDVNALDSIISDIIEKGFLPREQNNKKILLEFVSANPTGPLHIGHARGAIVGDALRSVGKFLGYGIDSEYYINDAGAQIKLLGISIQIAYKENISNEAIEDYPEEYYKGKHIVDATLEISKEQDADIFDDKNFDNLCSIAKDKMLELIKADLQSLDINFDYFVSEKEMYKQSNQIIEILENNNSLYEEDGKIWLSSSKLGDEKDRVVLKEDKTPTYLAGDIIYHNDKFKRDYDTYINIWGADHHGYIARVKASISFLGFDSQKLEIILSQMVALLQDGKPYKMSKRKGTFILLKEVVDIVGADALKLIFLSKKCDTHLEFDVSQLNKQDSSNPIFYIQYAHTRIYSLLQKSSFSKDEINSYKLTNDINPDLRWLLISSLTLKDVLENAFLQREINKLIDYIYQLASSFHSFYNQNPIIGTQNELEYLKALSLVATTIKTSLSVIGIKAKEKM